MESDLSRYIDNYCERLGPEFWAEPLNALSNAAFIIAALLAAGAAYRTGRLAPLVAVLCALVFAIGVGSFLFHTFATRWAALADVIPILLFILTYLFASARYLFGLRWRIAIPAALVAFIAALTLRNVVIWLNGGQSLNGSEGYAPALGLLIGASILLGAMRKPAAIWLAAAAGVFLLSLTARSTDMALCETLPQGTHYLWHILNGTMLWIMLMAFVKHGLAHRPAHNAEP